MPAAKGNQNARRADAASVRKVVVRCTTAELDSYHVLARGQGVRLAELVRRLLAAEQDRVDALPKSKRTRR